MAFDVDRKLHLFAIEISIDNEYRNSPPEI